MADKNNRLEEVDHVSLRNLTGFPHRNVLELRELVPPKQIVNLPSNLYSDDERHEKDVCTF